MPLDPRDPAHLWDMLLAARRIQKYLQAVSLESYLRVGQRNVLARRYGEIEHGRIWDVATVHVDGLVAKLEPLIPPVPPEAEDT